MNSTKSSYFRDSGGDGVPGGKDGGAGGAGSSRATQVSLPDLFKTSNFFIFF